MDDNKYFGSERSSGTVDMKQMVFSLKIIGLGDIASSVFDSFGDIYVSTLADL